MLSQIIVRGRHSALAYSRAFEHCPLGERHHQSPLLHCSAQEESGLSTKSTDEQREVVGAPPQHCQDNRFKHEKNYSNADSES
jgi:hypothetical protein